MPPLEIVPLTPRHFNDCLMLWAAEDMDHEPDLLHRLDRLVKRHPDLCKVALRDDHVVGCTLASYNDFSLYVFRLVVHASYRRQGIGRRLMQACEEAARSVGAAKVILHAEGEVAQWYERLGYQRTAAAFLLKVLEDRV